MQVLSNDPVKLRLQLLEHYLVRGLRDDEELRFFLAEYFSIRFAKKPVCAGHTNPLTFIADLFFERVKNALGFASRSSGKTLGVAGLNALDMLFKPGIDIASGAATLDQTGKGHRYLSGFLSSPEFSPFLDGDPTQKKIKLKNGSYLEVITGTIKGVNSPHPCSARMDEVELLSWEVLNEALSMSISKPHLPYLSQNVFTSTRKTDTGTMQRLLSEADKRRIKTYSWCIYEVLEKCERDCIGDSVHGDCPVYDKCGGKAHECSGWLKIEDFIEKASMMDNEVFEAQWECKKPQTGVTIYGRDFSEATHEIAPFPIPKEWQIVSAIDFGANFAYTKWAIDPSTDIWFGFYEYFCDHPKLLQQHADIIRGSPKFLRSEPIFTGTRGIDKQPHLEFKGYGFNVREAEQDILVGINEVKARLQRRRDFRFPNGEVTKLPCLVLFRGLMPNTSREFSTYSWQMFEDGTPDMENPQKYDDHCMSTVRYAVFSFPRAALKYRTYSIAGI